MKNERIQVRLQYETKKKLESRAKKERRSISAMAEILIENGLKEAANERSQS